MKPWSSTSRSHWNKNTANLLIQFRECLFHYKYLITKVDWYKVLHSTQLVKWILKILYSIEVINVQNSPKIQFNVSIDHSGNISFCHSTTVIVGKNFQYKRNRKKWVFPFPKVHNPCTFSLNTVSQNYKLYKREIKQLVNIS